MKQRRYFKDINKRKLYKNIELTQRLLKTFSIILNTNILKWVLVENNYIKFNCFKTKLKNFCVLSGRSKGINTKFKISRIVFREVSSKGYFFGLKKASW